MKSTPESRPDEATVLTSEQLSVQLRGDGTIWFNGEISSRSQLPKQMERALSERINRTIFFAVDDSLPYGEAVWWMAVARRAGATALALQMSAPKTGKDPGSRREPP